MLHITILHKSNIFNSSTVFFVVVVVAFWISKFNLFSSNASFLISTCDYFSSLWYGQPRKNNIMKNIFIILTAVLAVRVESLIIPTINNYNKTTSREIFNDNSCGKIIPNVKHYIYGGKATMIEQWPWQVIPLYLFFSTSSTSIMPGWFEKDERIILDIKLASFEHDSRWT